MDWDSVGGEVTGLLQDLLRIDTTNPPGNETACATHIAGVLRAEGIESAMLEKEPGRGNVIARLRGTGELPPLLLMAHMDVVVSEPEHWTHPPFAAEIAEGYLWGRGAVDTKNLLAAEIITMLLLRRTAEPLRRDVILMANADEEVGVGVGARWIVQEHPDLIRAEYAINEGGGDSQVLANGRRFMGIQVAEKGNSPFKLVARGRPGHGSVPIEDNAVVRLGEALAALGRAELPLRLTETMRGYVTGIAALVDPAERDLWLGLLEPATVRASLRTLPVSDEMRRVLAAQLFNTVVPTMLTAGSRVNVIPSAAEATVDSRVVPGMTREEHLAELRAVLGEDIEIEFSRQAPWLESSLDSPLFAAIDSVMAELDPGVPVLPTLCTGGTDAKWVSSLGTKVYGFFPMQYEAGVMDLVHGHDERISISNLAFGTRVLFETVRRFCGEGAAK